MMKMTFSEWVLGAAMSVLALSCEAQRPNDDGQKTVSDASMQLEEIVLGAGCFWGAEKRYEAIPGVIDAVSGYADGRGWSASYKEIIKARHKYDENNYAEVVKVTFDPNRVSLRAILENYFEGHDPTQKNRQGNDVGTQYRSTILTTADSQLETAFSVRDDYQALLSGAGYGKITTKIKPLDSFYPAEEYHQDYLKKNPQGYCPDHSTGVVFKQQDKQKIDNHALMTGSQIVVVEAKGYCPYCEKFKKEVAKDYQGSIPLSFRYADGLNGLKVKTPTWATPTILFLQDGVEVYGHQGYASKDEFYKALGAFKLGDSEAFSVAFAKGTDNRFCKQYEIFKNTPDGLFIDKLSGVPLFDTRDRFNSGTGWLSFTKPVDGAVSEHQDLSFGMRRIELRSVSSDIHLGHVFPGEGPGGKPRYCINATVLDFKPRTGS